MSHSQRERSSPPEVVDYATVSELCPTATVHRVVTSLSFRMCNYFDGMLTDGTSTMRLDGFRGEHQKSVLFSREHGGDSKNRNTDNKGAEKIKVPEDEGNEHLPMIVAEIKDEKVQLFQKVSTNVKVGGLEKQDVDQTDTINITLWESLYNDLRLKLFSGKILCCTVDWDT